MNWHDGLILIWQLHGYGLKPWRAHINFIFFWAFWIWLEYERVGKKTLVVRQPRGGWKGALMGW